MCEEPKFLHTRCVHEVSLTWGETGVAGSALLARAGAVAEVGGEHGELVVREPDAGRRLGVGVGDRDAAVQVHRLGAVDSVTRGRVRLPARIVRIDRNLLRAAVLADVERDLLTHWRSPPQRFWTFSRVRGVGR